MKVYARIFLLLNLVLMLVCSCHTGQKKANKTVSEKLDSILTKEPNFSGVILLASHGKPIYHKAFGYRNFEIKVTLDTTSIFELASVSKQFTAMIIMILHEENKLSYDDLIEKYIPGLPYPGISIRHLLTHTSGLPDYQDIMDQHWDKTKVASNEDIIIYLKKYHPEKIFEPGSKYTYSNTGYILLGSIAEKAAGKDFIAMCQERIFNPIHMTSTNIRSLVEKRNIENFAMGHIYVESKNRYIRADSFPASNYTIWLGNRKGPGRISSTSADLLKWDQALYTEALVKNKTLTEAFSPMRLNTDSISNYGFGWDLRTDAHFGKIVQHTGDNPGYKTIIIRYIDQNKTLVILCNNAYQHFDELTKLINELIIHE